MVRTTQRFRRTTLPSPYGNNVVECATKIMRYIQIMFPDM
jgi:hypothetical protein